jgi:hypothetical protein
MLLCGALDHLLLLLLLPPGTVGAFLCVYMTHGSFSLQHFILEYTIMLVMVTGNKHYILTKAMNLSCPHLTRRLDEI